MSACSWFRAASIGRVPLIIFWMQVSACMMAPVYLRKFVSGMVDDMMELMTERAIWLPSSLMVWLKSCSASGVERMSPLAGSPWDMSRTCSCISGR